MSETSPCSPSLCDYERMADNRVELDADTCEWLLGDCEPLAVAGKQETIGTAALYETGDEFPDNVAAIVVLTANGQYYGEAYPNWPEAGYAWLAYEDAFTLEREEPVEGDIVFYQSDDHTFYVLPHHIKFTNIPAMDSFLRRHLYPKGRDKSKGRRIWFYDAIVGNYHLWPVVGEPITE